MQLIINTWGTYLHVKDDMFEVRVPVEDNPPRKQCVASQKITSILLSKGAAVSSDAIILAMKNNIDIVVLERDGFPVGRFWHSRLGSTTRIRKKQLETSMGKQGVTIIKHLVGSKLQNQSEFLKRLKKHREQKADELQPEIDRIEELAGKIQALEAEKTDEIADTLRGIEGTSGRIYFGVLSKLLAKKYRFSGRSFRPATDPFNAFLNYAYGILYSRVEKALIVAGLDPFVGILHRDDYNKKSMVFDFIEPYRTWADEVIFKLFSAKKVNDSHTSPITNGVTLNTEGKALLVQHFFKFFDEEKIRYKNRNQSRSNILQLDAHALAQQILNA
ncbi:CRISPR-associated protein, Cas1 family [Tangfeifania diversioriginum]|uniref:CRISPR-associated endonuclease Cas1 n=1 Tax=Tangfeifania diversioriginum TaxID=1168035 RepID=A0A1M6IAY9_9BACT|nr:CRISPR-associated endonuclease Cas1 [Tangfeifania diversioriginum]SHJ31587.1 CRISPR-associated protein, Cas1 family [Tangfeifania diversioriginum]